MNWLRLAHGENAAALFRDAQFAEATAACLPVVCMLVVEQDSTGSCSATGAFQGKALYERCSLLLLCRRWKLLLYRGCDSGHVITSQLLF